MKKLILLFFFNIAVSSLVSAQQKKETVISGKITFLSENDTLKCRVFNYGYVAPIFWDDPKLVTTYKTLIKNGSFVISIKNLNAPIQEFFLEMPGPHATTQRLLVEPGDRLKCQFSLTDWDVDGVGALKNKLLKRISAPPKHHLHYDINNFPDEIIGANKNADTLSRLMDLNKKYLSPLAYQSLKLRCNIYFFGNAWVYPSLFSKGHYNETSAILNRLFRPLYEKYSSFHLNRQLIMYDSEVFEYLKYRYTFSRGLQEDFSKKDLLGLSWFLRANYTGEELEKLLTFSIMDEPMSRDVNICYDYAMKSFKNPKWHSLLKEYSSQLPGIAAYNFTLLDTNNVTHRLSDYQGKIVIVDLWFTGCGNCKRLTPKLKAVEEKFKDNANVIFISVCADKGLNMLKKSIKGGEYTTSDREINLYAGEAGDRDPFFTKINLQGYPTLKLIDKDGKWCGNPVDCRIDDGKDLIQKINLALEN